MFKEPKTDHNFIEMEKKWLKHWYEDDVVKKYLHKNDKADKHFTFQDGPITANNPMGVHHAWGRSYKDLWQKFHNLLGYKERFQNGFDCQGLWVEVEVEKELGLHSKKDIENLVPGDKKASIAKFVDLCKQRVMKFSGIQTEQTKRLGNFMDWEHSYYTMSDENNYMIWYFLKKCYENGWIYKGHDSVPWCPRCETAISQHEMLTEDYKEVVHETIYFKLHILNEVQPEHFGKHTYLVAWTTTPWTVPGNVALAINPNIEYVKIRLKNDAKEEFLILAKSRVDFVFKKDEYEVVDQFMGEKLLGIQYEAPFDHLPRVQEARKKNPQKFHTVVNGEKIVMEGEGTGILHVAPGQGKEDFDLGKKEGLPIIELINDTANYYDKMGEFSGKNAKKHPELIIDFLKTHKNGEHLLKTERYKHRYPACWRCKSELVWRVTDEWYIAMDSPAKKDEDKRTLRERMVDVAKKINWKPEFGLERELDWLEKMHDWLISKKNRFWGLALPIYECPKCHKFEVIGGYDELKARAVEGWKEFEGHTPHKPYIDEVKIKCADCGEVVKRVDDVGNVWLDAGIVPYSTLVDPKTGKVSYITDRKYFDYWFPADFITESFPGQFKNWFYSMIAMSTVLENTNPFKTVLGFATMTGEDGRPMHKSWGNYIEFNEGADKIGVDVMRWMFARQNPTENMPFGYKKADEVRRQFYLILWNVYKFFVEYANLEKVKLTKEQIEQAPESANVLDIWILNRFAWTVHQAEQNLRVFNAKDTMAEIEKFISDLSTWYIRRSRNRVWMHSEDEKDKKSFYGTMYYVLTNLSIILSPIIPFVTEEIYTELTKNESVHLSYWPKVMEKVDEQLTADMELVRSIVEVGHRVRKEQKLKVRQPLAKAKVEMNKTFKKKGFVDQYHKLLQDELNVKNIELIKITEELINVEFDTKLTPELIEEGEVRELIRTIQGERKQLGVRPNDLVDIRVPEKFSKYADQIKKSVLAQHVKTGEFKVSVVTSSK